MKISLRCFLLLIVLGASACSGPVYVGKREYVVTKIDGGGEAPPVYMEVTFPATGARRKDVFRISDRCSIFGASVETCQVLEPAWSPDGERLAFIIRAVSASLSGPFKLGVVEWDGNTARNGELVNTPGDARNPAWDPVGKKIVYESAGDIWISNACDPSFPAQRVTTDAARDRDPSWSRDGKWIAFVSNRSGDDDIWVVGVSGGSPGSGGSPSFTFSTPSNWTNTPGVDESLPYFSEIGPDPTLASGIDQLMFQKEDDLWWVPVPAGNAQPTQITTDGRKKLFAEYSLNNLAVAFVRAGEDQVREVMVSNGREVAVPGTRTYGGLSSRQEWTGTNRSCP